ncbi:MAG: hypothetical protein O7D30_09025, partial [Rickettsia endosymbiont of Ixodes persulcatus]|nr:hypothetical protein [Rickettsia endosymbiont of Ixodes persulcatus]
VNSLNNIRKFSTCSNNNNDNRKGIYLGSYLAGLFEGVRRGHISISKPGSKSKNLSLSITFHLKDLPLAVKLKEVTGFG